MSCLDLYYTLRPILPRRLQVQIRRWASRPLRWVSWGSWPTFESAGRTPDDWPGWPDDKRFAVVLTHDVETQLGHDRCRQLMDCETELGFRSAFNFVPERYEVSEALRHEIGERGFEVGVHGLRHDGKLLKSRAEFDRRAVRINQYLEAWGAVGFRAPSMRRDLRWIQALNIEYDCSTFDTDPFEPQPTGERTIFPFWVEPTLERPGFVELPYTLPQDLNLFTILGEKTIDIWKRKVDWIAERGGMAMVIVHPDYIQMDGRGRRIEQYPLQHYRDLLEYIRTTYKDQYWHALPREVARHCAKRPATIVPRPVPKRVCMMAYAFYDTDHRIIRYAETLAQRGDDVEVIGLRRPGQAKRSMVNGVRVFRIQERERNEKGAFSYLSRILAFWVRSWAFLSVRHLWSQYDLVHVHSVPDFEVFAAGLAKWTGARIILDIHDIVPELYATKFGVRPDSFAFKMLVRAERASTGFAHHVIVANHIWQNTLVSRSMPANKCSVVMNSVNMEIFYPRPRTRSDAKTVIVYPGILSWHQGLATAIEAVALARKELPLIEFHIYGDGGEREELDKLVAELNLKDVVSFHEPVPAHEVAALLANADLGVEPKRADSFADEAFSTKIPEYMSQSVPVIISRTTVHEYYFDESLAVFFESGNAEDLAQHIVGLVGDKELRERLVRNGLDFVSRNNWDVRKHEYLDLVRELTEGGSS